MSVKNAVKLLASRPISSLLQVNQKMKDVRIQGWVRRVETRGKFLFLHISDGYSLQTLQAIVQRDVCPKAPIGSAVDLVGDWVKSPGKQQNMELFATNCEIVGLQQKSDETFIHVDPPLLTHNDCEGAGDVFSIQADRKKYFGEQAVYLPVSCQLHLEAFVGSIPKVYTIAPALRADHSQTRQHLAEFRMLEAEYAFADDLEQLCDLVERYINYVVNGMLDCAAEEVASIMQVFCDESAKKQSLLCINGPRRLFPRMSFTEALAILQRKGETIPTGRLNKENELSLVQHCAGPVFVLRYPHAQKPFYMKRCGDDAECFDLLAPFVGELAGGSLRESDPEELRRRGCDESLDWYLEMRQHGHPPSAGFGIGMERLMQALFGVLNIKDTVAFPRWYGHCPC